MLLVISHSFPSIALDSDKFSPLNEVFIKDIWKSLVRKLFSGRYKQKIILNKRLNQLKNMPLDNNENIFNEIS